ncbi:thioesterase family protein [Xylariaceae sp. FL0255]|nr:thioesterase family protein [Xylariaceae sp. FL0255]
MSQGLKQQIGLQQTGSDTFTCGWHPEWTLGSTIFGGSIAAIIHSATASYATTHLKLKARNQPDILSLHLEFLRPCNPCDSTITVTLLKTGALTSMIQLRLSQNGQIKIVALAILTNFDKSVGPTVPTAWSLLPSPEPVPDFGKILARQPDDNWLSAHLSGEIISVTKRLLFLNPRKGHTIDGVCDGWYGFLDNADRYDATYVALMTDVIPSMSDTLLRNNGLYDAHATFDKMASWAKEHPGIPVELVNTVAQALQATIYNNTITLDIEFKRRVPEGLRWLFTRVTTKKLHEGRMDLDITMCDGEMELLCTARQLILVLEAERKFSTANTKPVL